MLLSGGVALGTEGEGVSVLVSVPILVASIFDAVRLELTKGSAGKGGCCARGLAEVSKVGFVAIAVAVNSRCGELGCGLGGFVTSAGAGETFSCADKAGGALNRLGSSRREPPKRMRACTPSEQSRARLSVGGRCSSTIRHRSLADAVTS